jgi:cobalt transporter subunit CbtB
MTTMTTRTGVKTESTVMQAVFVALLGGTIVFLSGFAHSETLHDAAHDVRHATGFPCH